MHKVFALIFAMFAYCVLANGCAVVDTARKERSENIPASSSSTKGPKNAQDIPQCSGNLVRLICGGEFYCVYPGSNCCGQGYCGPGQRCEFVDGRRECKAAQ